MDDEGHRRAIFRGNADTDALVKKLDAFRTLSGHGAKKLRRWAA